MVESALVSWVMGYLAYKQKDLRLKIDELDWFSHMEAPYKKSQSRVYLLCWLGSFFIRLVARDLFFGVEFE